jgi:hypothetical protein
LIGRTEAFGQRAPYEIHRVKAALSSALPVQGRRHNGVRSQSFRFFVNAGGQSLGKPLSKRLDLFVFQQNNGPGKPAIVESKRRDLCC